MGCCIVGSAPEMNRLPKLQMIKRANGSLLYSVNIPLEVIQSLDWKKGDLLSVSEISDFDDFRNPLIVIVRNEDGGD